jgi:hypothetical protein
MVSIILLSVGLYFSYIWAANYYNETLHSTMPHTFSSPHFILTVAVTTGMCYITDLFYVSYIFNFKTQPVDFLRLMA